MFAEVGHGGGPMVHSGHPSLPDETPGTRDRDQRKGALDVDVSRAHPD